MAKGIGKQMGYQTRRKSNGHHPDFQNGERTLEAVTPGADTVSWWCDTAGFYATARQELDRMNRSKFGRLQTEFNV